MARLGSSRSGTLARPRPTSRARPMLSKVRQSVPAPRTVMLFDLDVELLHQRAVARIIVLDLCCKLLDGAADRLERNAEIALAHRRIGEDLGHLRVQPRNDGLRCLGRCGDAEPLLHDDALD